MSMRLDLDVAILAQGGLPGEWRRAAAQREALVERRRRWVAIVSQHEDETFVG